MAKQHIQKVIAHAEEKLQSTGEGGERTRPELLKLYKGFLKVEEHRIRMLHNAGGGRAAAPTGPQGEASREYLAHDRTD